VWRSVVQKFSSGGSGFDPSFSKTEKVRFVGVDQIRQCSRIERMENGVDVESAQSEVGWATIQFNVTRKRGKVRRSGLRKRSVRWRAKSRKTADWVRMRWECCRQAMRCREGWTWQEGEEK